MSTRAWDQGSWDRVYGTVLAHRLMECGLHVERQKPVSFVFDGHRFEEGFRTDLLVERRVVVELNSVEAMAPVHAKQSLTYLRLLDPRYGLLINFGAAYLKQGIKRVVNGYG